MNIIENSLIVFNHKDIRSTYCTKSFEWSGDKIIERNTSIESND